MRDFLTAALPLVLLGLAIALFAASAGQEPTQNRNNSGKLCWWAWRWA